MSLLGLINYLTQFLRDTLMKHFPVDAGDFINMEMIFLDGLSIISCFGRKITAIIHIFLKRIENNFLQNYSKFFKISALIEL